MIQSKLFWIATAIFLTVTLLTLWFLYPPALAEFNNTRNQNTKLSEEIATSRQRVASLNELKQNKTTLNDIHQKAVSALPTTPSADLLLLQLDGLAQALGLDLTITVPFNEGAFSSQVSPTPAIDDGKIKQGSGSAGSSAPIITSSGAKTEFTLAGKFDFATTLNLLTKLKTFSRWNNVTTIDISGNTTETGVTVSGQVFWTPDSKKEFSGDANTLLQTAQKLFSGYQNYAAVPDFTREGQYGRSDPFATL